MLYFVLNVFFQNLPRVPSNMIVNSVVCEVGQETTFLAESTVDSKVRKVDMVLLVAVEQGMEGLRFTKRELIPLHFLP